MANRWQTFPVSFTEGELTNLPLLEQGLSAPSSARKLTNLEVSPEGGYRSILGYTKFDTAAVPPYGVPFVQGAGQTGTTLNIVNVSDSFVTGSTFRINGTGTVYTVSSVVFNAATRSAAVTFTPTLSVSPADKSTLVFTSTSGPNIEGVSISTDGSVFVKRGGAIWNGQGSGWAYSSVPFYGDVKVSGGGQTGTSLVVSGLTHGPVVVGDCFTIAGVALTYTVTNSSAVSGGGATLTITPALASSPSNTAQITFVGAGLKPNTGKLKSVIYRFAEECRSCFVDGLNRPFTIGCGTKSFEWITNATQDTVGASSVAHLRNSLFFSKNSFLTFTAPATDNDFDTGNGAGVINVGSNIVALTPFKDNLVIFSSNKIDVLRGSSAADYQFTSLTDRIGCVSGDTPVEVGGDILYLSPDGVRFLSDVERSGDFGLDIASDKIKPDVLAFIKRSTSFQAVTVRNKNQYRLFGFVESTPEKFSAGFCGTQFGGQGTNDVRWSQLVGFKVYHAASYFTTTDEIVVFVNRNPYVYRMESGQTFDGSDIPWLYRSPWWSLTDPVTRKTMYKAHLYTRLSGNFMGQFKLNLDFDEKAVIKPSVIMFETTQGTFSFYGSPIAIYGTSLYGGSPQVLFNIPTVGNGGVFSIELSGNSIPSTFTLDNLVLEFGQKGRK